MTPVSQIVWKNRLKLDSSKPVLLVCPAADDLARKLASESFRLTALCHSHGTHARLRAAGISSSFSAGLQGSKRYAQIILFQPREKPLLEMMLGLCGSWLEEGGTLWLAGANRAGIKSAGRRLTSHFRTHSKIDNARHCVLFRMQDPLSKVEAGIEAHVETWTLESAGKNWQIVSLPGVFAHRQMDEGSRLLLDSLTQVEVLSAIRGRVLDFACGAGVIGIPLAGIRTDVEVTLLDDSALALEAASRSLRANQVDAGLLASDGMTEIFARDDSRFDWIVSNPPFHSGGRQDLGIAERFIRDCPYALKPEGRLCLVANVHLPYGRWLQELFGQVQVIASDRGYNVWLAQNQSVR